MKKILFALSLIVLTGAGCVSLKTKTTDTGGIFVTTDAGAKWTAKSILPLAAGTSSISSVDVTDLRFDPNDNDALYVGTKENGLLVSYDHAESWQRVKETQLRSGEVVSLAIDPKDKCTVYVAKGSTLMKSTDCLRTFDTQAFVETNGKTVEVVKVDWYNHETLWLGTAAGDIVKSTDMGAHWATMKRAKDEVTDLLIDNADSRIVLAITKEKGMWRTTDGGENWTQMDEAFANIHTVSNHYALTQTKDGSVTYDLTNFGILRSADHGASWEALTLLTKPGSADIFSLAVSPDDANVIFYGTASTLYSSTDGGVNWSTRALPTSRVASTLAVDPADGKTLWMGAATVEK